MPHITWCATGPLAFLPLHAAGLYDSANGSSKASEFVVSSYTPSLSALLAPLPAQRMGKNPRILVVSQPDTPHQNPLPCTTKEAYEIRQRFPDSVHYLTSAEATVDAVVVAMGDCDWVHLACHGVQAPAGNPARSAFLLYDDQLELSRLMRAPLGRAELAVLSACQTARGDNILPEEAAHLAAGMLAAGFRGVIGTMWSIHDADGPVLTETLCAALKRNVERGADGELKAAHALHEAVAALKETVGEDNFERWVPFVHFGL
jgi:CHAT domain-containing protein